MIVSPSYFNSWLGPESLERQPGLVHSSGAPDQKQHSELTLPPVQGKQLEREEGKVAFSPHAGDLNSPRSVAVYKS